MSPGALHSVLGSCLPHQSDIWNHCEDQYSLFRALIAPHMLPVCRSPWSSAFVMCRGGCERQGEGEAVAASHDAGRAGTLQRRDTLAGRVRGRCDGDLGLGRVFTCERRCGGGWDRRASRPFCRLSPCRGKQPGACCHLRVVNEAAACALYIQCD